MGEVSLPDASVILTWWEVSLSSETHKIRRGDIKMSIVNKTVKKKVKHIQGLTAKEAPHVRRWVLKYLKTHPHLSLEDLARRYWIDLFGQRYSLYYTDGFCNQAKLMLIESRPKFVKIPVRKYKLLTSIAALAYDIHTRNPSLLAAACKRWGVSGRIGAEQLLMEKIESI